MVLRHLSVINYKNIVNADLEFSSGINCFVGSNGEGKTNMIDAIYFLSFTKSSTNIVDSMNIRHGEDMMMLKGEYNLDGVNETISCGLKLRQKKQFRRGDKIYKRMMEHIGLLPLVLVSPNDQELVTGSSENRRRFLDAVLSQHNPAYLELLQRNNKALQQRNILLKQENYPVDLMDAYEEIMASTGTQIYHQRKRFVESFIPVFQQFYNRISSQKEAVGIEYNSHCQRGELLDVIRSGRDKDLIMGYSLHGVHKDDLVMTLNDFPLKREGSQGQSKTYLISLKLAQFNFLKDNGSRTMPILLLDDIFDKLDAQRVEKIVELVSNNEFGQIFITDTNREHLDLILKQMEGEHRIFHVKGGDVSL